MSMKNGLPPQQNAAIQELRDDGFTVNVRRMQGTNTKTVSPFSCRVRQGNRDSFVTYGKTAFDAVAKTLGAIG